MTRRYQALKPSALVSLLLAGLVAGCGDDIVIEYSDPVPPEQNIPFDEQKALAGGQEYAVQCLFCHGEDGLSAAFPAITRAKYATSAAIEADLLASYTDSAMPTNPEDCVGECADNIQNYFYKMWSEGDASSSSVTESSSSSSSSAPLPDRSVRNFTAALDGELDPGTVAAGEQSYKQQCITCHGDFGGYDGQKVSYTIHNHLEFYVHSGLGLRFESLEAYNHDTMPEGSATSCENQCADDVSAYIRSWTAATGEFEPIVSSSSASVSSMSSSQDDTQNSSLSSSSLPASASSSSAVSCDTLTAKGRDDYESYCQNCHGRLAADGSAPGGSGGGAITPTDADFGRKPFVLPLNEYIEQEMSFSYGSSCVVTAECSNAIAAYMLDLAEQPWCP